MTEFNPGSGTAGETLGPAMQITDSRMVARTHAEFDLMVPSASSFGRIICLGKTVLVIPERGPIRAYKNPTKSSKLRLMKLMREHSMYPYIDVYGEVYVEVRFPVKK